MRVWVRAAVAGIVEVIAAKDQRSLFQLRVRASGAGGTRIRTPTEKLNITFIVGPRPHPHPHQSCNIFNFSICYMQFTCGCVLLAEGV